MRFSIFDLRFRCSDHYCLLLSATVAFYDIRLRRTKSATSDEIRCFNGGCGEGGRLPTEDCLIVLHRNLGSISFVLQLEGLGDDALASAGPDETEAGLYLGSHAPL